MTIRRTTALTIVVAACLLQAGCHDDDACDPIADAGWVVSVSSGAGPGGDVVFAPDASYERLTVGIAGYSQARDGAVVVTSDADWLTVTSDTLAADSAVLLTTLTNDTGRRRAATLVFQSATTPARQASVVVSQLSAAEQDHNGGDARSALYVGYGYDIYAALDNPMSVRTKQPIIDLDNLRANSGVFNFEAVHDAHVSVSETKNYYANSLYELATTLTGTSSNADVDIAGSVQTCERVLDATMSISISEQNIGYGVMVKTVASRVLDMGALKYLQKIDEGSANSNRLSLSYDFKQRLAAIAMTSGQKRAGAIESLLLEYGTHVVVQADLGGKIDYAFTMDCMRSFRPDIETEQEVRYTLGQLAKENRTAGLQEVSSDKAAQGAIQIWGGSPESRALLQADIDRMRDDHQGHLAPENIQQWLASINYSAALANDANLDVVHFELMPVWDLVPTSLRQDFIDATLLLARRSDCQLPASALGTDIYALSTSEASLFGFNGVGDGRSLCRLLYCEGQPVVEVCSEYVPKICTDRRVTVAYPVSRQKIRMNQGLFVGDGVHQPAIVAFSGSDCYVNPIDTIRPGGRVGYIYYVNGTLMLKNPTTLRPAQLKGKQRHIADDVLTLYSSDRQGGVTHQHPIVKIGSAFWTRHDIDHQMYFAEQPDGKSLDELHDGVLYTQFQWAPSNEFLAYNDWTWGYRPNTFFADSPNTSWFLPTPAQVADLQAYIGFNPKALFKGQVSGFNAEFNGYYGGRDILSDNAYFDDAQRALHYKGALNVICSNTSGAYADACLMVLKPDYTITTVHDKSNRTANRLRWRENFYPVRAVRGWQFQYPLLAEINDHLKK